LLPGVEYVVEPGQIRLGELAINHRSAGPDGAGRRGRTARGGSRPPRVESGSRWRRKPEPASHPGRWSHESPCPVTLPPRRHRPDSTKQIRPGASSIGERPNGPPGVGP
jgi:hypothetical protein